MKKQKGFTLIELLIVIAIIAILAAVVFVALNPLQRFQDARNSRRWADVASLINAIKVDQVDNGGSYIASIVGMTSTSTIGTCTTGGNSDCTAANGTATACVDLTGLVTGGYLGSVPMDPSTGTASKTDYYIASSTTGILTIGACDPENSAVIKVSR